ncbi:MAG: 4Fe-4S dicluster domain-containing protein [Thermodesulfobacteriota bacterium]
MNRPFEQPSDLEWGPINPPGVSFALRNALSILSYDEGKKTALKCNLCYHRVDQGLYPACADNVYLAHCIYFGDPAEIQKQILEKREARGGWGEIIPKDIRISRE